jgi:hypothetical protein
MLPVYAAVARDSIESHTRSALPDAPVVPVAEAAVAASGRRAVASVLVNLADRVSPEPVERSRWQSG